MLDIKKKPEKTIGVYGMKRIRTMDKLTNIIKIVLAVLFFVCLTDMPYGYYEFVRFIAMIGFAFLAFKSFEQGFQTEMFIYIALAILFQPFFKIALGRPIWNIVDIVVGLGLIISVFIKPIGAKPK